MTPLKHGSGILERHYSDATSLFPGLLSRNTLGRYLEIARAGIFAGEGSRVRVSRLFLSRKVISEEKVAAQLQRAYWAGVR